MLDIKLFRERPDIIKKSEEARGKDPKKVDLVVGYDKEWRVILQQVEELRHRHNVASLVVSQLKKKKRPVREIKTKIFRLRSIVKKIKVLNAKASELAAKRDALRYTVGNLLHEGVPFGKGDEDNKVIREVGKKPEFSFEVKDHVELGTALDLIDVERAAKVAGARLYYLKNEAVLLNFALIHFAIDFLAKQDFTLMYTPFVANLQAMKGAAELIDFRDMLYKLQDENLYLIATAEQPLAAYYMNETLPEEQLPIKFCGFSTNFRKEAGAHGKDTKGIFRVHQFDKVEQYVFCKPEDSWHWHERLIENTEKMYKKLGLPYRIVNVCSGELNDNGAKKYDLEVWFPAQNAYREVASCTNCTDYQARKLGIRSINSKGEKQVVHTVNDTAIATQRTIAAILENFQRSDGSVKVPRVLRKYAHIRKIRPKAK